MDLYTFKDYDPSNPWPVTDEPAHVIDSNGYIVLRYVPLKTDDVAKKIAITGYTETTNPSPGMTEFYVNYQDQTDYRMGLGKVKFNPSKAAATVSVTNYYGVSTVLWAWMLNELAAGMGGASWDTITNKPTTLTGFGITDALGQSGGVKSFSTGLFSTRPAPGTANRYYFASDKKSLYRDTGTIWEDAIGRKGSFTLALYGSNNASSPKQSVPKPVQYTKFDIRCEDDNGYLSAPTSATTVKVYSVSPVVTTLNGAVDASTVSIVVTDGSIFPTVPFNIIIDNEVMAVTARSTNTLTASRGQENSSAASHSTGATVNLFNVYASVAVSTAKVTYTCPSATLGSSITAGATTLTVSADIFPVANFRVKIDNEIMNVTSKSGTTFTVVRGIDGSSAATHASGASIYMAIHDEPEGCLVYTKIGGTNGEIKVLSVMPEVVTR